MGTQGENMENLRYKKSYEIYDVMIEPSVFAYAMVSNVNVKFYIIKETPCTSGQRSGKS